MLLLLACILLPPLCIARCIHQYRHRLDEPWIRCRLGFLYNGYRCTSEELGEKRAAAETEVWRKELREVEGVEVIEEVMLRKVKEGERGFPWWEVMVLLRRTAMSAISLLPSSVLQAVLAQAVFLLLLLAHLHCRPYRSSELNHLETLVLTALSLTQFGCVVVCARIAPLAHKMLVLRGLG